jgi:DNA-binding transcriptional ArsR family regulator
VAHSATARDYDAEDTLVVSTPEQLRALGDDVRSRIVSLLRDGAASATELAAVLGMPKGTVGHHLKVLERAGLVHVVRTRRVRAVTERYYGRVAWLFLIKSGDETDDELTHDIAAASFRVAAAELASSEEISAHAVVRVRLKPADERRFARRLEKLVQDFRTCDSPAEDTFGLCVALYRRGDRDA